MSRKVLITGGAGFIGTNLARALLSLGDEVILLDALTEQVHAGRPWQGPAGATLVQGDTRDRGHLAHCLKEATHVVHLAAETGTGQSMHDMARYVDVNCVGTAVLLEETAKAARNLRAVVLASSRAVYGEGRYACAACGVVLARTRTKPATEDGGWDPRCPNCSGKILPLAAVEDQIPRPVSCYGVTKLGQEQLLAQFCAAFGVPGTALRLQNVYGPGQSLSNPYTGILSIFSTRARSGKAISIYEDGRMLRDFVYVDDAVEAIRLALDRAGPDFEVFNIGSGTPVTVMEVARNLLKNLGLERRVSLQVTGQWRAGDVRHAWAGIEQAHKGLGFAPKVTLEQGLAHFTRWAICQPLPADRSDAAEAEFLGKMAPPLKKTSGS